jgi:hypothetical protein
MLPSEETPDFENMTIEQLGEYISANTSRIKDLDPDLRTKHWQSIVRFTLIKEALSLHQAQSIL